MSLFRLRIRPIWLVLLLIFFTALPLRAAGLKQLIILDFVQSGTPDKNYDYLAGSLADAVRKKLRESFRFIEMSGKAVKKHARDNHYKLSETDTISVPLRLGLELDQDVVIAGFYQVDSRQRIDITVRIFDIREKKVIDTIQKSGRVDNTIFQLTNSFANTIQERAARLFPGADSYSLTAVEYARAARSRSGLSLAGGFGKPLETNSKIRSGGAVTEQALAGVPFLDISYHFRRPFSLTWLEFQVGVGGSFSSGEINLESHSRPAPYSQYGLNAHAGAFFRQSLSTRWFWRTGVRAGYQATQLTLDYSNQPNLPVSQEDALLIRDETVKIYRPVVELVLSPGFRITPQLALETEASLGAGIYQKQLPLSWRLAGRLSFLL